MTEQSVDAVVVGAGFAGLYQLHRLRQQGLSSRVFEAASDLGGTWYWNRYPGARCDVPSIDYSYSFDPELAQEWEWTEKYATQPEILRYLEHVADRFGLRDGITFDTRVESAVWDEARRRWQVATDTGEQVDTRFLIMATGCLSNWKQLEVPGMDRFRGRSYFTGRWPHEGVDFSGQRVGVIGTGSSAVQSIPLIAEQATELTVFQRTPTYVMPALNRPLGDDEVREVKSDYDGYRAEARDSFFGVPLPVATQSVFDVSDEERAATYQSKWDLGHLLGLASSYTDILMSQEANDTAANFVRDKIRDRVEDPELAETLTPRSYPFATKRPCLDTNYYETFNKPHVHLVDLRKGPLVEITESGIRTTEREYEFDTIVYATGFDAMTGAINAVDIRGRDGVALRDKWAEGPRTYLGFATAGFPNLFMITGPGSPSVLTNMVVSIEDHVDLVADAIRVLDEHDQHEIEPSPDAEDGWVQHVDEVANATLFPKGNSWYMGDNVAGKPRVCMVYIAGLDTYRAVVSDVVKNDWQGFVRR